MILVPIDMPENCCCCVFCEGIGYDEMPPYECMFTHQEVNPDSDDRLGNCPLIDFKEEKDV